MATKPKGYGKKGKENIAVQLDRMHLSSPSKYHALADIDGNEQQQQRQPKPKKKVQSNRGHRRSITFTVGNEIDRADINGPMKKHLKPLFMLDEINETVSAFGDWARVWSVHCDFTKIAQGTYGAVFRIQSKAQPGTYTIGKLIPLQARVGWGCRTKEFTTIDAARNEVALLASLDQLDGFVQFRKAEILQGRLPTTLEEPSRVFDATQNADDISSRWTGACSNSTQLWLFLEMSDAGTDLETILKQNVPHNSGEDLHNQMCSLPIAEVRDIFWQVASALALAEKKFTFEHRDLHLGNICLTRLHDPSANENFDLWTDAPTVQVTIIDYTLSRAELDHSTYGVIPYFNDLSKDPVLFAGEGAAQYDIYRKMRSVLEDKWDNFEPLTNAYWLTHLLELLMEREPEECQDSDDMLLWNRLADLKHHLTHNDEEKKFGNAQDIVRFCEGVQPSGRRGRDGRRRN